MITLVTISSRNLNNASLNFGPVVLAQYVDLPTCGGILLRFEVESLSGSITITYAIKKDGVTVGSAVAVITAPGRAEIGFMRGDLDNTSTVEATVVVVGRSRVNGVLYSVVQGEDVLEWL